VEKVDIRNKNSIKHEVKPDRFWEVIFMDFYKIKVIVMIPKNKPTSPGQFIQEDILNEYDTNPTSAGKRKSVVL
jgi:hypothetical protein